MDGSSLGLIESNARTDSFEKKLFLSLHLSQEVKGRNDGEVKEQ